MNRRGCEREFDVVQALRAGSLSSELRGHVRSCAICAEAQGVAEAMLRAALHPSAGMELPAADLVWRRAEVMKREMAMRRATRPLIFMRALGVVYVVLSVAWLMHSTWRSGLMELLSGWNVLWGEATSVAAAMAVLAIVVGAGYLLRDSRQSGESVPST